jgi:peptide-methionine (S)-S-oxide reductase
MDAREVTMAGVKAENGHSIVLGGGCFWCLEAVFERVEGVTAVVSGYAGGSVPNPTYEEVCSGETGHAEVVKVSYDPAVIGLPAIFDLFFKAHDPTTMNRQGADVGTQYRSVILYASPEEKRAAEEAIRRARTIYGDRIVTELAPLSAFYPAEAHHQDYYARNPHAGYCRVVIRPKLDKLGLE